MNCVALTDFFNNLEDFQSITYTRQVKNRVKQNGVEVWGDALEWAYQQIYNAYGRWLNAETIPFEQCTSVGKAILALQSCTNVVIPVYFIVGFELYLLCMHPIYYLTWLRTHYMDVVNEITADNDLFWKIQVNDGSVAFLPKGNYDELIEIVRKIRNSQLNTTTNRSNKRQASCRL